jgi:hypothetical protein
MFRISVLLIYSTLVLSTSACSDLPDVTTVAESAPISSLSPPLVEIMRGLEADLGQVAHGIWTRNPRHIREAATRIAEHPKVSPTQLSAIKLELASEFGTFVQFDQDVHSAAVELADLSNTSDNIEKLFVIYNRIENGCILCHASFQKRVSNVLVSSTNDN